MNSFDARVRYTRMVIQQNFLELLKQKPVARITVTELCQKAQINRATFYKHYLDIPDLLAQIEEELFQSIRESFDSEDVKMKSFLLKMMQHTKEHMERYIALGSANGDPNLMTKTFMVCYESAYPLLAQNVQSLNESERQMLFQFISYGAGAALAWWVKDGMKEPVETVAQYILDMSAGTVEEVVSGNFKMRYNE